MFIDEDNKDRSGWSTSSTTDYSVSEVDQFNVAFLNWQYIKTIVISSHFVVLNTCDFLLRNTKENICFKHFCTGEVQNIGST